MRLKKRSVLVCALGLMLATLASAAVPAGKATVKEQPAAKAAARAARKAATTQPKAAIPTAKLPPLVRGMTLTEEQKAQMVIIRYTAGQRVQMIREKERADIIALLTDEQVVQLQSLEEQRKAKADAKRQKPTTAPVPTVIAD